MGKTTFNLFFTIVFAFAVVSVKAQPLPVASISQNFDVACVTSPYFASGWVHYNPVAATDPPGAWTCTATDGNHATPGMKCTGFYNGVFNLDTSYLVTPLLNISTDTGNIYLHFDSKTTKVYLGSKLSVIASPDTNFSEAVLDTDLTFVTYPFIGLPADSSGWVTHEVNLTGLKSRGNFYLGFRYTSTTTSGSNWYIDNVYTTNFSIKLGVAQLSKGILPLTVTGIPAANEITLSYNAPAAGAYHLAIYDMVGRQVYAVQLYTRGGTESYALNGLGLHAGMYCIKMDNAETYGIAKVMIR